MPHCYLPSRKKNVSPRNIFETILEVRYFSVNIQQVATTPEKTLRKKKDACKIHGKKKLDVWSSEFKRFIEKF